MEASYGREIHRVSEASLTYYTTKRDVARKKFLSYTSLWKIPSLSSPFGKGGKGGFEDDDIFS